MEIFRKLSTKEKALQINLRQDIYGTFAEIGAGQEVAANFFKAGGASGTIAKTMSAYDMTFSDAIYGKCSRYVAEDRLQQMLSKEYSLLPARLKERMGISRFFAFANTVEVLNYEKSNRPHGWMGLKFLLDPESSPNECIVHVNMKDNDNLSQQHVLGVIGVNLIYACYYFKDPSELIDTLMDELSPDRIEIDFLRVTGPDFKHVDNRLIALLLVRYGFTKATMFGADGNVLQPSEALYKKNVLLLRGRFKPVTIVNVDMLLKALKIFKKEEDVDSENIVALTELTLSDLRSDGEIDEKDFLNRADLLCSLGRSVMVSNYTEYYRLVDYLSEITKGKQIGIILGIYNLVQVFDESYYKDLRGGILEAFGILFGHNVKFYVYPSISREGNSMYTLDDMEVPDHIWHLLEYLKKNMKLSKIEVSDTKNLHIVPDDLLEKIRKGEPGWELYTPKKVELAIKEKKLFDYNSNNVS